MSTKRVRMTLPSGRNSGWKGKVRAHYVPPFGASSWSESVGTWDASGTQVTVSEGHPFHRSKVKGQTDIGGNFDTTRRYVEGRPTRDLSNSTYRADNTTYYYPDGASVMPLLDNSSTSKASLLFPPTLVSSDSTLNQLGTTAIARCEPTNSPADVATFLGELYREGLPLLPGARNWKSRTDAVKNSASDYLGVQFGWLPIAADIKSAATAAFKADKVLAQYERDSGGVVRRQYRFPIERSSTEVVIAEGNIGLRTIPAALTSMSARAGRIVRVREIVRRQWFSGAFTYYLPSDYDSRKRLSRYALMAEKVFGLELTPDVVWNLAPWSWAIDWFTDAGDVIHNISKFGDHGLIMRYGYIMEHVLVRDTYTCEGVFPGNGYSLIPAGLHIAPMSFVTETKTRRQANPFGFGVTWNGLSSFQASILAALGITRTR